MHDLLLLLRFRGDEDETFFRITRSHHEIREPLARFERSAELCYRNLPTVGEIVQGEEGSDLSWLESNDGLVLVNIRHDALDDVTDVHTADVCDGRLERWGSLPDAGSDAGRF